MARKNENYPNLQVIETKEEARERGRNGGKKTSLAKKLGARKLCKHDCPLWNNCWAKHTAHTMHEKKRQQLLKEGWPEKEVNKMKPECALKNMPSRVVERVKRFTIDGEEGFNCEIMETLNRLGDMLMLNPNKKDFERYLRELRECKKTIFGDKNRIDATSGGEKINSIDFAAEWRKVKEEEQGGKE